jgi:hypothetical protein
MGKNKRGNHMRAVISYGYDRKVIRQSDANKYLKKLANARSDEKINEIFIDFNKELPKMKAEKNKRDRLNAMN